MHHVNTDRLVRDLQAIVADTEQLLRASADHASEKVSQVRAHAERSLRTACDQLVACDPFCRRQEPIREERVGGGTT
jgi:ElaB/YqjD/DUF883 family membrane-anchored ribosome-binding protein